jgi:surface protein
VNSEENSDKGSKAEVTNTVGSLVGNTKQSSQKELPNTGTSTFGTILPAMAALLSGVGLFAKKKKEDE